MNNKKKINNLSLSDDKKLFIVGMNIGFAVYKCFPLELLILRSIYKIIIIRITWRN